MCPHSVVEFQSSVVRQSKEGQGFAGLAVGTEADGPAETDSHAGIAPGSGYSSGWW